MSFSAYCRLVILHLIPSHEHFWAISFVCAHYRICNAYSNGLCIIRHNLRVWFLRPHNKITNDILLYTLSSFGLSRSIFLRFNFIPCMLFNSIESTRCHSNSEIMLVKVSGFFHTYFMFLLIFFVFGKQPFSFFFTSSKWKFAVNLFLSYSNLYYLRFGIQ